MITFKSLSRIREFHGDPRLYQYGGLWIYPVGTLIKIALRPHADQAYYLDQPEAFGRFYIVARLYSAAWGLVAVWAEFRIVRRLSDDVWLAAMAAVAFALMPVVITAAHEAKPHLAGLALTLLAVLAAANYVETGMNKWAALAGALCGTAFAMVISALLAFAILPVMVLLGPRRIRLSVLIRATALGALIYVIFNPFVLIHLLGHREILRSNVGNSTAMYHVSAGGVRNALALIVEGASPVLVLVGAFGGVCLAWRRWRWRIT